MKKRNIKKTEKKNRNVEELKTEDLAAVSGGGHTEE